MDLAAAGTIAHKEKVANRVFVLGIALFSFLAHLYLSATTFYFFEIKLSGMVLIPTVIFTILTVALGVKAYNTGNVLKETAVLSVATAVLMFALTALSHLCFDFSWDGQSYHQETAVQLSWGWNPIWEHARNLHNSIIYELYPKATEIFGATALLATGSLEYGKAYNLIGLVSSSLVLYGVMRRFTQYKTSQIALVVAAYVLNPVAICQIFTYYVDGFVLSAMVVLCLALFQLSQRPNIFVYLTCLLAIVLLVCSKFTGVVFAAFPLAAYGVFKLWQLRFKAVRQLVVLFAMSVFAFCVAGFEPYINNMREGNHPFHPAAGPKKTLDVEGGMTPKNMLDDSPTKKLLISLVSRSAFVGHGQNTEKKFPFLVSMDEFRNFERRPADLNVAGFGPLFSGALLLAGLALALALYKERKMGLIAILLCAPIAVSILINPHSWIVRYAPQIWILPVLVSAVVFGSRFRPIQLLSFAALGVLILNGIGVAYSSIGSNLFMTNTYRSQVSDALAKGPHSPTGKHIVYFVGNNGAFRWANMMRLTHMGVDWEETVNKDECKNPVLLEGTHDSVRFCY